MNPRSTVTRRSTLGGLAGAIALAGTSWHRARADGAAKVGMTGAMTGPAAFLGRSMRAGLRLGLAGSGIDVIAYDDGYRPSEARINAAHLIDAGVLALVGCVGTPTSLEVLQLAQSAGVPFFGAFTGASGLRQPDLTWAFNVRASYDDELAELARGLSRLQIPASAVALVAQSEPLAPDRLDGYGVAISAALARGLRDEGLLVSDPVPEFPRRRTFLAPRNVSDVDEVVRGLYNLTPQPRMVVLGTPWWVASLIIKKLARVRPQLRFHAPSFVGTQALARATGPAAEGVIVTQVVPPPGTRSALGSAFAQDARESPQPPNLVMLEGYLVGRLLRLAFEGAVGDDAPPTSPAELGVALGRLPHAAGELGLTAPDGRPLLRTFDPRRRQFDNAVWPTIIHEGQPQWLDWARLRRDGGASESSLAG